MDIEQLEQLDLTKNYIEFYLENGEWRAAFLGSSPHMDIFPNGTTLGFSPEEAWETIGKKLRKDFPGHIAWFKETEEYKNLHAG